MHERVTVLTVLVVMLIAIGFATDNTLTQAPGPGALSQPVSVSVFMAQPARNTTRPIIHWDRFYDRSGHPLPSGPQANVGADSLFFKRYAVLDTLYGCPKSEVPDLTPAVCRTGFAFQDNQAIVCMDPAGVFVYEVRDTTLRRYSTSDGSYTNYTISNGYQNVATDGNCLYVPVSDVVYKYTLTGTLLSSTTLDITPNWYNFSIANDTVWCGTGTDLHGFACAKFTGGSITTDATWSVGSGSPELAHVAWDGQYYYVSWGGTSTNTFKRFNPNRTISATGTIGIDPRGMLCSVSGTRPVVQDSLYWKSYYSTVSLYSSPKAQDVSPAQPSPIAWQYEQTVPCMTPDGRYVFDVNSYNMRRTDLVTGSIGNYVLANYCLGACGTDGEFVYVPGGDTVRKYALDGTLVSSTATDHQAIGGGSYGFGVANDTVWLTPNDSGTTWYGYACSKFTGGSITYDAIWDMVGGEATAMNVAYDGMYYYIPFGGFSANTLLRFYRDRTLCSSGTVDLDSRGVMCKPADYAVMLCHGESQTDYVAGLRQMLSDSCDGEFAAVDTWDISTGGHSAFPAADWYNHGYRAILTFTNANPEDPDALGDSLARFVELGGGVVEAVFADQTDNCILGDWRSVYSPFTVESTSYSPGTMGAVHQPFHPVMAGVSSLSMDDYRTGNTPGTLRSPNCVSLAEFTDSFCVAACFDSAGYRAVSLGIFPLTNWYGTMSGHWCRLMVNALDWATEGPSIGVTAPNGGDTWYVGSEYDITWSQTDNGVSDSIYYSTDGGSSWIGVAYLANPPDPLEYDWTIPSTPTTQARVKVVTWDDDGGRVEDENDADFTIDVLNGVSQERRGSLPHAFALHQPCPNPSISGALVRYDLPRPSAVELRVYDVTGGLVRRLVETGQPAGYRSAYWNGCDERGRVVAQGVYYCRFTVDGFQATQKMIVRR